MRYSMKTLAAIGFLLAGSLVVFSTAQAQTRMKAAVQVQRRRHQRLKRRSCPNSRKWSKPSPRGIQEIKA